MNALITGTSGKILLDLAAVLPNTREFTNAKLSPKADDG
jgi:hypothetical protein